MMSTDFQERLFPLLPAMLEKFDTPFIVYDDQGIRQTCQRVTDAFARIKKLSGFNEFFAVKALPNPVIMKIMNDYGFGFDCSSTIEVELARDVETPAGNIMFTSNNTSLDEFAVAQDNNAVLNLDDISLVDKVPEPFPKLVSFRYNPGPRRTGNSIIGKPSEAKYGIMDSQLESAYSRAKARGATRFGIHTMVCSNQRNYSYMVDTAHMLLTLCARLHKKLGIKCEFMNIGGGIGIPYRPQHRHFQLERMAGEIYDLMASFKKKHRWVPKLFMESGRFMTGPHGALVNRVINRKEIYETHVGVEVAMPALMRHAIYGAYHHATVVDSNGHPLTLQTPRTEVVNIVGSICENCDRLATQRLLPKTTEGDFIVTHDVGAHGIAMGFNYNGRVRPQEIMLYPDGSACRIRRAETNDDLRATLQNFDGSRYPMLA